jgi:hypothetical protein
LAIQRRNDITAYRYTNGTEYVELRFFPESRPGYWDYELSVSHAFRASGRFETSSCEGRKYPSRSLNGRRRD